MKENLLIRTVKITTQAFTSADGKYCSLNCSFLDFDSARDNNFICSLYKVVLRPRLLDGTKLERANSCKTFSE